jgi:DNA-binding beta-propeller fold protein YncE
MSTQPATKTFSLEYVKTIGMISAGGSGVGGRGFLNPVGLDVSSDGRIFVVNRTQIRVCICNMDEEFLGNFSSGPGSEDGQLHLPTAMAFDSLDRLYVTDEMNHRVSIFDTEGNFLGKWGEQGDGDGQLNGPSGIDFDSEDNAYVVDQHNHRVQKYSPDGEYLLQWGEFGEGDGQLNLPWGLGIDGQNNVYVADWRNDRIQKFSPDGRFLASYGESGDGDGQFNRPADVAVDRDGYMYVADWENQRVQVLDPDGVFQLQLRGQATLSQWADDFFAANPDEGEPRSRSNLTPSMPPHLDTPYHAASQSESLFWEPICVTLDRQGQLYVTESRRHRFQVYQRT